MSSRGQTTGERCGARDIEATLTNAAHCVLVMALWLRAASDLSPLPSSSSALLLSYFSALEVKFLRVSISSFLEMLAMATDTLAQFSLGVQGASADNGAAS